MATTISSYHVHHRYDRIETHHGKMDSITHPLCPTYWKNGRSLWAGCCFCSGDVMQPSEFFAQMGKQLSPLPERKPSLEIGRLQSPRRREASTLPKSSRSRPPKVELSNWIE